MALVASYLPAALAADLLSHLPAELQAELARRIAIMEPVDAGVVADVASELERKMAQALGQRLTAPGGAGRLVEILHSADPAIERAVLAGVAREDVPLARDIRHRLFAFEELAGLSSAELATLAKNVEPRTLAAALAGSGAEVRQQILQRIGHRTVRRLYKEIKLSRRGVARGNLAGPTAGGRGGLAP